VHSVGQNSTNQSLPDRTANVTSTKLIPYLSIQAPNGSRHVSLSSLPPWTVGRGNENTSQLIDPCASRNHVMIQQMEVGSYYLIDLGSRNGTILNGKRITIPTALKNGDRITIGETTIEFCCPDSLDFSIPTQPMDQVTDTMVLHRRRLITVLVVDIRDFTKLSQQVDDRLLSQVIGTWFRRAGEIIGAHGSWVDKYIGDAVMAVWIHSTTPGIDKISTSEMMLTFQTLHQLANMSDQLNNHFDLPFPLRVGAGMNTGYAMVGQMGSSRHTEYTALGDTVNTAFRLESATKQVGVDIILGQGTYAHTPYAAVLLPFKQYLVDLKGYSDQILSYGGSFEQLTDFIGKIGNRKN
jgi:adenylate cyclase